MPTKEQKVEELVEWIAKRLKANSYSLKPKENATSEEVEQHIEWIWGHGSDTRELWRGRAKQILSHPDLYIEREALFECSECGQGNFIPIAEVLKEASHPSYKSRKMLDELKEKE